MVSLTDESFFITGGRYQDINENVLKHSMGGLFEIQTELKPMVVHNESYYNIGEDHTVIMCVAISPDDRRLSSIIIFQHWYLIVFGI